MAICEQFFLISFINDEFIICKNVYVNLTSWQEFSINTFDVKKKNVEFECSF